MIYNPHIINGNAPDCKSGGTLPFQQICNPLNQ